MLVYSIGIPSPPQFLSHHPETQHPDISEQSSPDHSWLVCPTGTGESPAENKGEPRLVAEPRKCGQDPHRSVTAA